MNAIVPANPGSPLMPQNLDQAMRLAEMMARGKMVPDHLRNPADALLVIEQAMRWAMSPFAVAQCTSVIQGRLMFEGKLVAAAVQSCGLLSSRLSYDFDGEGAARAVTVTATIRGEDKPRTIRITLAEAKTTNQMWTRQPDQQLVYFGTRAWARRHAPEVMLGVYSPEEFEAPAPRQDFAGPTIDAIPTPQGNVQPAEPDHPKAEAFDARDRLNAEVPLAPPRRTARQWLDDLRLRVAQCQTTEELDHIATGEEVQKALKHLRNGALEELNAILADAMERLAEAGEVEVLEEAFPGDVA
jgi:hypothetical protein